MKYLLLIIIAIAGIIAGRYFARREKECVGGEGEQEGLIFEQSREKVENKEKILEFLKSNDRITNNEVEGLLGVSDSTATRYLDELEKEGKIKQIGTVGHAVFYLLT